jgi:hypothetical protein
MRLTEEIASVSILPVDNMLKGWRSQHCVVMSYKEWASSTNPTAMVILLDQSTSMGDSFGKLSISKAQGAANAINGILLALITKNTKGKLIKDRIDVCVIPYGLQDSADFQWKEKFVTLTWLNSNPLPNKKIFKAGELGPDGTTLESDLIVPMWFLPVHNGNTPMCKGLGLAKEALSEWLSNPKHSGTFPPMVVNITDGEANDGDPEPVAQELTRLSTSDGSVWLWNCHITGASADPILLPASEDRFNGLSGKSLELALQLYRMSSVLPPPILDKAAKFFGESVAGPGSRCLAFNSDLAKLVDVLTFGTIPVG